MRIARLGTRGSRPGAACRPRPGGSFDRRPERAEAAGLDRAGIRLADGHPEVGWVWPVASHLRALPRSHRLGRLAPGRADRSGALLSGNRAVPTTRSRRRQEGLARRFLAVGVHPVERVGANALGRRDRPVPGRGAARIQPVPAVAGPWAP